MSNEVSTQEMNKKIHKTTGEVHYFMVEIPQLELYEKWKFFNVSQKIKALNVYLLSIKCVRMRWKQLSRGNIWNLSFRTDNHIWRYMLQIKLDSWMESANGRVETILKVNVDDIDCKNNPQRNLSRSWMANKRLLYAY